LIFKTLIMVSISSEPNTPFFSFIPNVLGDIVIVRKQPCVESGETAIVLVNGNDATVKQVKETDSGTMLIGHNTAVYTPHFYSKAEIEALPVQIIGKVAELRRKF